MKQRSIPLASLFLIAILALSGCTTSLARGEASTAAQPTPQATQIAIAPTPTPVVLSTPNTETSPSQEQQPASTTSGPLVYNGDVLADEQVPIVPEVPGQVAAVFVQVGDSVKAGDPLIQLESSALEAQWAQALAALEAAQAQLELLTAEPEEIELEAARAAVAAAEASYERLKNSPTEDDLIQVKAQLRQAEAAVKVAQAAYDQVAGQPYVAALPQSLQLEQATIALEAARAAYEKVAKGPTEDMLAGAYARLAQAKAQLHRLEEGPRPAQIKAAKAQVKRAQAALNLAEQQLDKATIRAPIDGVVAQVNTSVGAMAGPTSPVILLISHDVKIVISVEEFRMSQVRVGQQATIRVNAYPDRVYHGVVSTIAPMLDPATRTVQVTIRPTGDTSGLAPGMFATVELEAVPEG